MLNVTANILLIEDDLGDQALTRRALHQSVFTTSMNVVDDGHQALDYLCRRGSYTDPVTSPRPDLILLDLNLPKLSGHEVLRQIRADSALRRIPVVVLTTSTHRDDVARSYDLGANSHIAKPNDMDQFVETLNELAIYWFEIVRLPEDDQ